MKILKRTRPVTFLFLLTVLVSPAMAQTGALGFATQLNSGGGLYHDSSYTGAEVVYRSSGVATPAGAHAAWQRSSGHARLINAGLITDVQCVGNVCVGRGGAIQSTVVRSRTVTGPSVRARVRFAAQKVFRRVSSRRGC